MSLKVTPVDFYSDIDCVGWQIFHFFFFKDKPLWFDEIITAISGVIIGVKHCSRAAQYFEKISLSFILLHEKMISFIRWRKKKKSLLEEHIKYRENTDIAIVWFIQLMKWYGSISLWCDSIHTHWNDIFQLKDDAIHSNPDEIRSHPRSKAERGRAYGVHKQVKMLWRYAAKQYHASKATWTQARSLRRGVTL